MNITNKVLNKIHDDLSLSAIGLLMMALQKGEKSYWIYDFLSNNISEHQVKKYLKELKRKGYAELIQLRAGNLRAKKWFFYIEPKNVTSTNSQ